MATLKIGVYIIQCLVNNKKYVGSSKDCLRRMHYHRQHLRANKHWNKYLQEDWNKYEEALFTYQVVEIVDINDLTSREDFYMELFNSRTSEFGYNIATASGKVTFIRDGNTSDRVRPVMRISSDGTVDRFSSVTLAAKESFTDLAALTSALSYWTRVGKAYTTDKQRRTAGGYLFVYENEYNAEFDYINWRRERKVPEKKAPSPRKKRVSKKLENPNKEQWGKNCSIELVDIITGECFIYESQRQAVEAKNLLRAKIYQCLCYPFKQRSHRGFWMRRIKEGE